jgi:hypothetical protein
VRGWSWRKFGSRSLDGYTFSHVKRVRARPAPARKAGSDQARESGREEPRPGPAKANDKTIVKNDGKPVADVCDERTAKV